MILNTILRETYGGNITSSQAAKHKTKFYVWRRGPQGAEREREREGKGGRERERKGWKEREGEKGREKENIP